MTERPFYYIRFRNGDVLAVDLNHEDTHLMLGIIRPLPLNPDKPESGELVMVYGAKATEANGANNYYLSTFGRCWINTGDIVYICPFDFPKRGSL